MVNRCIFLKNKGEIHMNMEAVFGHFPLLESEKLVLSKIEEKHVQDVFFVFISSLVRCHIIFCAVRRCCVD